MRRKKAPHGGLKNATGIGHKKHAATGEGPQWAFTLCSSDFCAENALEFGAVFTWPRQYYLKMTHHCRLKEVKRQASNIAELPAISNHYIPHPRV